MEYFYLIIISFIVDGKEKHLSWGKYFKNLEVLFVVAFLCNIIHTSSKTIPALKVV